MSAQNRGGDLKIVREELLTAIPRGDDELRVSYVQALAADGKTVSWISLRVFFQKDGTWLPGKAGLTIRNKELRSVAEALSEAANGTPTAPARATEGSDDDVGF